ncbi:hypothetical protein J1614_005829 [Plenodomus biglobosus]|nr:hypothetical protein J1614_005829 [Plenodomus biglobosus]
MIRPGRICALETQLLTSHLLHYRSNQQHTLYKARPFKKGSTSMANQILKMDRQTASELPSSTSSSKRRRTTHELPPGAIPISESPDSTFALEYSEYPEEGEQSEISKMFWMGPGWTQSQFDKAEEKTKQLFKESADMEEDMKKEKAEMEEKIQLQKARAARWEQEDLELQAQAPEALELPPDESGSDEMLEMLISVLSEDPSGQDAPVCDLGSVMALYGVYLELSREDGLYLGFEDFCIMFDIQWY